MTEAEDEVRATLEGWAWLSEGDLKWLDEHEGTPEQPEEQRSQRTSIAKQRLLHVPLAIAAAESCDVWTAIRHAMWVAYQSGIEQSLGYQEHSRRKLRLQEPAVRTGTKVLAGASKGGKKRGESEKIRDARESIRERVAAEHKEYPKKKYPDIIQRVSDGRDRHANEFGGVKRSVKQIGRITEDMKW